jgi:hypothetical protein
MTSSSRSITMGLGEQFAAPDGFGQTEFRISGFRSRIDFSQAEKQKAATERSLPLNY